MFPFKLVSLSGIQFDDTVVEVLVPTLDGEIGVLKGHMPLVSVAKVGVVAVRRNAKDSDDAREYFAINGGVLEVADGSLSLLVDEADHADDINQADAQAAFEKAQQMLGEATDQVSLEKAQALVDRQSVRLQITSLKRRTNRRR